MSKEKIIKETGQRNLTEKRKIKKDSKTSQKKQTNKFLKQKRE